MSRRLSRPNIVVALVMVAVLSGCTAPSKDAPSLRSQAATTEAPTGTPTPTVDPAVAAAEVAVLEAYRGFWAAKVAWYADPSVDTDSNLSHYAIDKALADTQSTVLSFRAGRIVVPGEPVLSPSVSGVTLGEAPRATIRDCVDISNWQAIFRDTRENAVAPGQLVRVVALAEAAMFDGRWVIRTYAAQRDRSC